MQMPYRMKGIVSGTHIHNLTGTVGNRSLASRLELALMLQEGEKAEIEIIKGCRAGEVGSTSPQPHAADVQAIQTHDMETRLDETARYVVDRLAECLQPTIEP